MAKKIKAIYVRNFLFGVEDSLVSTVGFLAGLTSAELTRSTVLISGIVLIFVEAFSMGAGSFLAEESAQEYESHKDKFSMQTVIGAVIMFLSYLLAGLIPLAPYIVLSTTPAFVTSITLALICLFTLGAVSAYHFKHKDYIRHAVRMFAIGGLAALAGIIIGKLFNI